MSSDSPKPLVLIIGATGLTGESIVQGLLESGNFRVAAMIRESSLNKPATRALRDAGIEIRVGDVTDAIDKLKTVLSGVDILISAVYALLINDQKGIIRAAKELGTVQRVIPCDFGTPGARGVRDLHDMKYAIHDYIEELGVPHTYIDVGWWMQLFLPLPSRTKAREPFRGISHHLYNGGRARTLITDLRHVGAWVARIIADPRTLNQSVIVWEEERLHADAHEIAERYSGEAEYMRAQRTPISAEDLDKWQAEAAEALAADSVGIKQWATMRLSRSKYARSMYFLEENTLASALKLGYLDARALYPDMPQYTLEGFAAYFYAKEEPGDFVVRRENQA